MQPALGHEVAVRSRCALPRSYLRIGAWTGDAPARDPDFDTAELFLILPIARVEARYARRCLAAA